jgi:uncharacterized membrane protein
MIPKSPKKRRAVFQFFVLKNQGTYQDSFSEQLLLSQRGIMYLEWLPNAIEGDIRVYGSPRLQIQRLLLPMHAGVSVVTTKVKKGAAVSSFTLHRHHHAQARGLLLRTE